MRFKLVFLFLLVKSFCLGQEPGGPIGIDLKYLPLEEFLIDPSYKSIGVGYMQEIGLDYIQLKGVNTVTFTNDTSKYIFDGSLAPRRYILHVSRIQHKNKNMYIYIYMGGGASDAYVNRIPYVGSFFEMIFYENLEFSPGTYLINLYDENNCMNKKMIDGINVSRYYKFKLDETGHKIYPMKNSSFALENFDMDQLPIIVTNKGVQINKLGRDAISPEELLEYMQDPQKRRSRKVQQLLKTIERTTE